MSDGVAHFPADRDRSASGDALRPAHRIYRIRRSGGGWEVHLGFEAPVYTFPSEATAQKFALGIARLNWVDDGIAASVRARARNGAWTTLRYFGDLPRCGCAA